MSRQPLKFYRLWCGRKRYSGWLPSRAEAFEAGVPHKVTFEDGRGRVTLGPLAWIEVGERRYPRSRTVTVGREM